MGLDWDLLAYPLAPSESQKPLRVTLLPAQPPTPSKALDARAHFDRGILYVQLRQYSTALADFKKAKSLDPNHGAGRPRAMEDLRKAASQVPASEANKLAWYLGSTPDPFEQDPLVAIAFAMQATAKAPTDETYWLIRGIVHYRAGQWDAAVRALEKAEELAPGKYFGFNAFFLAMSHHQLGNPVKAGDYYDRAVAWTQRVQGQRSAIQQNDLKRFRAEAQALLKRSPTGP
jgi:tetratricopeptide (TPR) repeat protein